MKSLSIAITVLIGFICCSCDAIIEVPDISNDTVVALAPLEGSVVESNAVSFLWEDTADAERYRIQVATPNFQNASQILTDSLVSRTNFSRELLPNSYEWRVRAENSGFASDYTTNTFAVQEPAEFSDNVVILDSPQENFLSLQSDVTFSWGDINATDNYRFQLIDASGNINVEQDLSESNLIINIDDGSYTWRIRAEMGDETTLYSSRRLRVDATAPNTPVLSMPANMSSQTETQVNFSWMREDVAGTAEFDSIFVYRDQGLTMLEFKDESINKSHSEVLLSGSYFWNLKAYDEAGLESAFSETFSFTIN